MGNVELKVHFHCSASITICSGCTAVLHSGTPLGTRTSGTGSVGAVDGKFDGGGCGEGGATCLLEKKIPARVTPSRSALTSAPFIDRGETAGPVKSGDGFLLSPCLSSFVSLWTLHPQCRVVL